MRKPSCDIKELNKGAWSKQEDQKLIDYIKKHGEVCWRTLPQAAGMKLINPQQRAYIIIGKSSLSCQFYFYGVQW